MYCSTFCPGHIFNQEINSHLEVGDDVGGEGEGEGGQKPPAATSPLSLLLLPLLLQSGQLGLLLLLPSPLLLLSIILYTLL